MDAEVEQVNEGLEPPILNQEERIKPILNQEERIKETAHMCTMAADMVVLGGQWMDRTMAVNIRLAVETAIRAGVRNGWLVLPDEIPEMFRPDLGLEGRG